MRSESSLRLPGNFNFNQMLCFRSEDGALDMTFRRIVRVESCVAKVCEFVIFDLLNDTRLAFSGSQKAKYSDPKHTVNSLGLLTWLPHFKASSSNAQRPLLDFRVKESSVKSELACNDEMMFAAQNKIKETNLTLYTPGK